MSGKLSDDDDEALDELFALAVDGLARGSPPDLEALLADRPALRPRVEQVVALAREVSGVGAVGAPLPRLEGFTLLEEIGRGGMGIVYRARQDRLGREVAIKVLAPALVASPRARERFALEAKALARLRHPHIVVVHEVVVRDDLCAHAMEWVPGTTLAAAIAARDARLTPVAVARLGVALAEALAAVHAAGLVHRDVKPANVLLRSDLTPVLTDFSLVHDAGQSMHTATGQFLGTLAFAAPEQLRGEPDRIGPRTDVYGLGITLWSALAGQPPLGSGSTATMLQRIERGELPSLRRVAPHVPRDLATIVHTAMERDPERRYADAAALAADLRRLLAFEPIQARPAGVVLRLQRWLERSPQLAAALLALCVAVVLGLGAAIWLSLDLAQQRDAAQAAERRAQTEVANRGELVDFLKLLVRSGDATLGDGRQGITVREAVEHVAAQDLSQKPPAVEATLRLTLGELLGAIGLVAAAEPHLVRAFELMRQLHGDDAASLADAGQQLSRVLRNSDRVTAAADVLREVVGIRRALAPSSDLAELNLAQALNSQGIVRRQLRDYAGAEASLREAQSIYRSVLKLDEENVALVCAALATLYLEMDRVDDARREAERGKAAIHAFHRGKPHLDVAHLEFTLASVRWRAGERDAGVAAMRAALAAARALVGDRHATVARMRLTLGRCLRDGGDAAAAAVELRAAVVACRELGNVAQQGACAVELAEVLVRAGDGEAALAEVTPWLAAGSVAVRVRALCVAASVARGRGEFAGAVAQLAAAWAEVGSGEAERRLVAEGMVAAYEAWGGRDAELVRWRGELARPGR